MSFSAWKRFKKSLSSTLTYQKKIETAAVDMETADETNGEPDRALSPCSVANVRPEFVILDLAVKLKELVNNYDCLATDETDLDEDHAVVFLNLPTKSVAGASSTRPTSNTVSNTTDILNRQNEIEMKMYEILELVHRLCVVQVQLEGCVLRELRHLQEYVLHKYPTVAEYLRTPFIEVIECVQSRTKGLAIVRHHLKLADCKNIN
jgi:hypothetical protein